MRCSQRTLILVACAALALAAFWPALNLTVMSSAAAQSGQRTMKKGDVFVELSRSRIEAILAEPVPDVTFNQLPLREVLVRLKQMTGIAMYFDGEELGDVIDPDVPVVVNVAADSMSFRTLINEFILGPNDLVFVIRDNYLVVMSYDKSLVVPEAKRLVIYNCRDLLVGFPVQRKAERADGPEGEPVPGGTELPAVNSPKKTENLHQFGMGQGFGVAEPGGSLPAAMSVPEEFSDVGAREQQLIDLIRIMVRNDDSPWDDVGGAFGSSVETFNGMLVVRARPEMHEQVRRLLRLLREAAKEREWPADLGDWPHRRRISPPAAAPMGGGLQHGTASGFF